MYATRYTAEIYKRDRRVRSGERLVLKQDFTAPLRVIESLLGEEYPSAEGYRVELHETFVTRTNSLTGQPFQERYDTPRACSPASDLYWSM